jgi:hypothetical protein
MRNVLTSSARMIMLAEHLKSKAFNEKYTVLKFFPPDDDGLNMIIGVDGVYYNLFPFVLEELPVLYKE